MGINTGIKTNVAALNSTKQVNIGFNQTGYLQSLSSGLKLNKAVDLTSDVNVPPLSSSPEDDNYCTQSEELEEDQSLGFGFGLDQPYAYKGGSIIINDKNIPESYALNPEYWKAINVYNKSNNTTITEIVPSDAYKETGLRVFVQGESISIGQFFYYNPNDSKCYIYRNTDTNRNHIDRILGVCVLDAINNKFFGLTYGLVNFNGSSYDIGKNYYIGNEGYWIHEFPIDGSSNVRVPIGRPIDEHTMYLNIREAVVLTEENGNEGTPSQLIP